MARRKQITSFLGFQSPKQRFDSATELLLWDWWGLLQRYFLVREKGFVGKEGATREAVSGF